MAYGPSQAENLQIALHHVDKILKGTKVSELPIEQPTKFEFVDQSKDGEADRRDDSADRVGAGGQGNPMTASESLSNKCGGLREPVIPHGSSLSGGDAWQPNKPRPKLQTVLLSP